MQTRKEEDKRKGHGRGIGPGLATLLKFWLEHDCALTAVMRLVDAVNACATGLMNRVVDIAIALRSLVIVR